MGRALLAALAVVVFLIFFGVELLIGGLGIAILGTAFGVPAALIFGLCLFALVGIVVCIRWAYNKVLGQ